MNLFKRLFASKDEIIQDSLEKKLKASYKKYIAQKEYEIVKKEQELHKNITSDLKDFEDIIYSYEQLEILKNDIIIAKETYEYIFIEKTTAEETTKV